MNFKYQEWKPIYEYPTFLLKYVIPQDTPGKCFYIRF